MVEKMGHKKMMQNARMEWINEGKPHSGVHEDSLFDEPELPARPKEKSVERQTAGIFERAKEGAREKETTPRNETGGGLFGDDDDLYDATPKPTRTQPVAAGGGTSLFGPAKNTLVDDGPPEDDLDALLAQEESLVGEKAAPAASKPTGDDFDEDDLDALMAEEMMQTDNPAPALAANKAPPPPQQTGDFDADMEEAMAEMDGLWD